MNKKNIALIVSLVSACSAFALPASAQVIKASGGVDNYAYGHGELTVGVSSTDMFSGDGEPVVAGKVTAVSSSTISITNNSDVTYTIEASNAKVFVNQGVTTSLEGISVGDTVLVQGEVSGTDVTATSILDQTTRVDASSTTANKGMFTGFFSGVGQFFMHVFGF